MSDKFCVFASSNFPYFILQRVLCQKVDGCLCVEFNHSMMGLGPEINRSLMPICYYFSMSFELDLLNLGTNLD